MQYFRRLVNFLDRAFPGWIILFALAFTVIGRSSAAFAPLWILYVSLVLTWMVGKIWFWAADKRSAKDS